ncbi:MAG: transglutaminase-like domain-containing protein [Candidatus Aminicenantales bacterium]
MTMRRRFRMLFWLVLFSPSVFSSGPVPSADDGIWSVIKIAGIPVGYETETRTEAPGGGILTVSESKIVLNRLGNKVELVTLSRTEEDSNGRLRRVETELRASTMSTRSATIVKPGVLEIESEAGGKKYVRTVPYSGDLLGPEGIRLLTVRKLRAPGEQIEYQTLSAESGTVAKGRRRAIAREAVLLDGRNTATLKIEENLEASGLAGFIWLDENGDAVKGEMPTPFGLAEIIRADRETALASAAGGDLPAEMYERSMIKSNVRLPRARALEMLRVKLTLRNPRDEWPNLDRPGQTIVFRTGNDLMLEIRRLPVPAAARRPVAETDSNREFLRPNEYVQSDLQEIREIALSVVAGESDVLGAALKLERWVADNMTFDLGIALAPASELVKNRRGTCLGYATLLASLARAVGIPSRIVLGYVYALGMFGGHAWTEIQVGEDWVPIDAAVVSAGIADPARIGFSASSLRDGPMSLSSGAAARLFGGTDIRIAAFRLDGRTMEIPETATAFRTEGENYFNPGLGLVWTRPPGFVFSGSGAVWPDPTVVVCEGGDAGRVAFQEMTVPPWKDFFAAAGEVFSRSKLSGPIRKATLGPFSGLRMEGSGRAAAVFDNAPDVWIFIAEGRDAPAVLTRVLEGLRPAVR